MEKKKRNSIVAALVVATAVLAAMGCWFCWQCPSRYYGPPHGELFWRQLAWNGLGLVVFFATWAVGWKRLLKTAPCLLAAWVAVFVASQFEIPVNGARRWFSFALGDFTVRVNVVTIFMPVLALFLAWLHERKWIRPWMEWAAIAAAVAWALWHVVGSGVRMERLMAFLKPGDWMLDRAYMARQLLAAFDASKWFGGAGRSLGFLPCLESDGMMSASALIFGKWFPSAIVGLFAAVGACLTLLWRGVADAPRRRFTLLFGLWLMVPAAYCLLHSLALLPVAGMSPALAGYGGTAVVMAWFGVGTIVAMSRDGALECSSDIRTVPVRRVCASWGAVAGVGVLLIAFAPKREFWTPGGDLKFAEPRPSDMQFGEFGLVAKRGRILASDGSPLAYTVRAWRFYLDPISADLSVYDKDCFREIAEGLGVPAQSLLEAYVRNDRQNVFLLCCEAAHELGVSTQPLFDASEGRGKVAREPPRYIFLSEADDDGPAVKYFNRRRWWLTRWAGIICEPVQKRVYPLGSAAVHVVGFMTGGAHTETPRGAGGLEFACNKALAGVNGAYDRNLPVKERYKRAIPKRGADIKTTLVPEIQKVAAEALSSACATNGAESAFALVMKVPSGEIAAMASWPSFDPSMRRYLDKWDGSMAVNRPAQVVFEPGALAKPIVEAIAKDVGELPKEKLHEGLIQFGFGAKTGTAGIPGEETGFFVGPPNRWDETTEAGVSEGFGFAATGLQIAQAYATLANHGTLVRPVLVEPAATNSAVQVCNRDCEFGQTVYSSTNNVASCAGFVPADNPEYVVVVSFFKPRSVRAGEDAAKPVFQEISNSL